MIRQLVLRRQTFKCLKSTPQLLAQTPVIAPGPEAHLCSSQARRSIRNFLTRKREFLREGRWFESCLAPFRSLQLLILVASATGLPAQWLLLSRLIDNVPRAEGSEAFHRYVCMLKITRDMELISTGLNDLTQCDAIDHTVRHVIQGYTHGLYHRPQKQWGRHWASVSIAR